MRNGAHTALLDPIRAEPDAPAAPARVMEKYIAATHSIWFNSTPVWEEPVASSSPASGS